MMPSTDENLGSSPLVARVGIEEPILIT